MAPPIRNRDVDWDAWPVEHYLSENYRQLHPSDLAVIDHHSAFYRKFAPDSFARSVEFGAGPNLYPLMLAAAVSRHIDAVEPSAASLAYLRRQVDAGPDESWDEFYKQCRARQPELPVSLAAALARVEVRPGGADEVERDAYDLASMHFVAESVTEERDEFRALCARFVESARPGAPLVAAFMENMSEYGLGDGSRWPGYPVDVDRVADAFEAITDDLVLDRIDADETLPDYGYTGMVLLTGRRSGA
jgi:hypothetical protein